METILTCLLRDNQRNINGRISDDLNHGASSEATTTISAIFESVNQQSSPDQQYQTFFGQEYQFQRFLNQSIRQYSVDQRNQSPIISLNQFSFDQQFQRFSLFSPSTFQIFSSTLVINVSSSHGSATFEYRSDEYGYGNGYGSNYGSDYEYGYGSGSGNSYGRNYENGT